MEIDTFDRAIYYNINGWLYHSPCVEHLFNQKLNKTINHLNSSLQSFSDHQKEEEEMEEPIPYVEALKNVQNIIKRNFENLN